MSYIVHRRFRGISIFGPVNLPYGTHCTMIGEMITLDGKPLCAAQSENSHQYFARNDDGHGLERGKLTQSIQRILSKRDSKHQARWDKVWADPRCQLFKRPDHKDYWLWNHDFFEAPVEELRRIYKMLQEV